MYPYWCFSPITAKTEKEYQEKQKKKNQQV